MKPAHRDSGNRMVLAAVGGYLLGLATFPLILWVLSVHAPNEGPNALPTAATMRQSVIPAPPIAGSEPLAAPPAAPPMATAPPLYGEVPAATPTIPTGAASGDLAQRHLLLPVAGIRPEQLRDTYDERRGGGSRAHEALDIMASRGTPILATEDGRIVKLFNSKPGGLTIYQFDPSDTYAYYYAHLDHYADGVAEGMAVRRGQLLGYVGSTGNAAPDGPHLHFAIFLLTPEKHWWQGTPINPYRLLGGRVGEDGSPPH